MPCYEPAWPRTDASGTAGAAGVVRALVAAVVAAAVAAAVVVAGAVTEVAVTEHEAVAEVKEGAQVGYCCHRDCYWCCCCRRRRHWQVEPSVS